MIKDLIAARQLPALLTFAGGTPLRGAHDWPARRRELADLLSRCEYGYPPVPPKAVAARTEHEQCGAFGGFADYQKIRLSFDTPGGEFSFPVDLLTPGGITGPFPVFVDIAFRPDIPDRYFPVGRILARGFAVARFCYQDIVPDEDDGFASGLAAMCRSGARRPDEWGNIGMWAWAASRVADCLEKLSDYDTTKMAAIGHSRLPSPMTRGAAARHFRAGRRASRSHISRNASATGFAATIENMQETKLSCPSISTSCSQQSPRDVSVWVAHKRMNGQTPYRNFWAVRRPTKRTAFWV